MQLPTAASWSNLWHRYVSLMQISSFSGKIVDSLAIPTWRNKNNRGEWQESKVKGDLLYFVSVSQSQHCMRWLECQPHGNRHKQSNAQKYWLFTLLTHFLHCGTACRPFSISAQPKMTVSMARCKSMRCIRYFACSGRGITLKVRMAAELCSESLWL